MPLSQDDMFCTSCGMEVIKGDDDPESCAPNQMPQGIIDSFGSVTALRSTDRASRNYQTVVFRNNTDADLIDIVIRTHNHIKSLKELGKGKLLSFAIPRDAQRLFLAANSGDTRLSLCWDLVKESLQTRPVVEVKGATDVKGNIKVKVAGEEMPEIVVRDAADVHGDIELEYTQVKEDEKLIPLPLASEDAMAGYLSSLSCRRTKRFVLFAGNTLSVGRGENSLWQVHCREQGGTDILLADKHGQKYSFTEHDLPSTGYYSPVSRVHSTIKWDGTSRNISIIDGDGRTPSSLGIYVDGLLVESTSVRRRLPLTLSFGKPSTDLSVDLRFDVVMTPDHKPVIFIHQRNCLTNETVIWIPGDSGFGFAAGLAHHWEPTWSKANEQMSLLCENPSWKIASAQDKSMSWSVYRGMRLAIDDLAYSVCKVDKDLLIMEHCR